MKFNVGQRGLWAFIAAVVLAQVYSSPSIAITCGGLEPMLKSISSTAVPDSTVSFYNLRSSLAGQNSRMTVVNFSLDKFKFESKLGTVSTLKNATDFIELKRDSYFVNADFFDLRTNYPRSLVVSDGQLQYLPEKSSINLSLVKSNDVEKITRLTPTLHNEVVILNTKIPIDSVNKFLNRKATTIYNASWGKKITPAGLSTLVLNANKEIMSFYSSGKSISPQKGYVIQFGRQLRLAPNSQLMGQKVEINSSIVVPNKGLVLESVGRGESLIAKGEIQIGCSTTDRVRPRTAIGWDSKGKIWLVTVTSGKGVGSVSGGLRLGGSTKFQLAAAMRDIGILEAVNLDGGSSTNLWMSRGGKLVRLDDKSSLKSRDIATGILFSKR